jgi:hypothetical protein
MTPTPHLRDVTTKIARDLLCDRTIILTGAAAGSRILAEFFTSAGAHPVTFALHGIPDEIRSRFLALEHALAHPDRQLRQGLDALDPTGTALVYAGSFTTTTQLCGRTVIGARASAHLAAENKLNQRSLLDRDSDLIDLPDGLTPPKRATIVQGVPRDGLAMATSHTYLLPARADRTHLARIAKCLACDCDQALTAPFDRGIPCTFYGFVTDSHTIDFGPVEALVYWHPDTYRLHAPGILRPLHLPASTRNAARAAVHRVATKLHQHTGYVGAFGTDGTVSNGTYRIHEINPRVCAGFALLDQLAPQAAPLIAVDLLLRGTPHVYAERLTQPLIDTAEAIAADRTPAYRLWDSQGQRVNSPAEPYPYPTWAAQVRHHVQADNKLAHLHDIPEDPCN